MKRILGLDLGTNSIGWALIEIDHKNGIVRIIKLGSRIIPMDAKEIGDFESKGVIKSKAAQRTESRGPRRLNERFILRRDRLHLVLNLLKSLPQHYKMCIQLNENQPLENQKENKGGQFIQDTEPKIAFKKSKILDGSFEFLFEDSYQEMLSDMNQIISKKNVVPKDWTLYYLRQKALTSKISLEEFAWVLLSYNQKRGYEKTEALDKSLKENEIVEQLDLMVEKVVESVDKNGNTFFFIHLNGNDALIYQEYSKSKITEVGDLKEVEKISKTNDEGIVQDKKTEFKITDIYSLEVSEVYHEFTNGKNDYSIHTSNGWFYKNSKTKPTFQYNNLEGRSFDYIVETSYLYDGAVKRTGNGDIYRTLREPDFSDNSDDWTLLKKKTEKAALAFNSANNFLNTETKQVKKYISPSIYDQLKVDVQNETQTKIIGGLFQVVDRDYYREELNDIISEQRKHHTSLSDNKIFDDCIKLLYPKNETHLKSLQNNKNALQHLLVEDILLYQRPLRSKKSEIADCKYEYNQWEYAKDKNGNKIEIIDKANSEVKYKKKYYYKKVAPASHPLFQEFRIWDKIHNLKIIQFEKEVDGKLLTNVDVSKEYLSNDIYSALFKIMNQQRSIEQKKIINLLKPQFIKHDLKSSDFVWNYPEDEKLKGNETRVSFCTRFKRCGFSDYNEFLTQDKEIALWHYLYSVSFRERNANNRKSLESFFKTFFGSFTIDSETFEKIVVDFSNYPQFSSRYCSYSEKALKKLLPFMRINNDSFADNFDISEHKKILKNLNYKKKEINEYVYNTDIDRVGKEQLKRSLHQSLWKYEMNTRIDKILNKLELIDFDAEVIDDSIAIDNNPQDGSAPYPKGLFKSFKNCKNIEDFKNLNLTQASYLVYGRHSELSEAKYWISPEQIRKEIHHELKQHSLNNPVAEKVLLEMMQVVADIWEKLGNSKDNYFTKIHVEVGRDLKKSASEKENEFNRQKTNKVQNDRIRNVLEEHLSVAPFNARPKSSDHFERLKILENAAFRSNTNDKAYIKSLNSSTHILKKDFEKYKLWVEQGYKSPYTDRIIKMTDLFDGNKYNIDHILPQALVTNNSLSNKVVCETEVNKVKSNQTGRDFILNPNERIIYCVAHNQKVEVVNDETYVTIVNSQFTGTKKFVLLSKDVPKGFTDSQKNNMRHISRKAMELLSHIVREPDEIEFRSKNVLPVTGRITSELKKEWKLNEVWAELVAPRFIRMNELTQSNLFGNYQISTSGHKYFDCKLDKTLKEKDPDFNIKRIDHRHHALDALIVALCTEDHVNYINNYNSRSKSSDFGKQQQIQKYRQTLKRKIKFTKREDGTDGNKNWFYLLPGEKRKKDAQNSNKESVEEKVYAFAEAEPSKDFKNVILQSLQHTIPTFKQNLRVINKTVNKYRAYKDDNGNVTKTKNWVKQKGSKVGNKENWAIRRSLGKETYYGRVNLKLKKKGKLKSNLQLIYENIDIVVDEDIKNALVSLIETLDLKRFKKAALELLPNNPDIEIYYYTDDNNDTKKIAVREAVSEKFDHKKIYEITDSGIRKILTNHLVQFNTTKLPFDQAIEYYDAIFEKEEIESIIRDEDSPFETLSDFISFMRSNNFKYQKNEFTFLNLFITKVNDSSFHENIINSQIEQHPEIAFTPEELEKMNGVENLKKLNNGKSHMPIKKVRVARGYGKQRALNPDNKKSVKSKQYVVNDAGSNLYQGIYERRFINKDGVNEIERAFDDIGLIDLIEKLKQGTNTRTNPLPGKYIDHKGNEYDLRFSISPLDLVYVPTDEELELNETIDVKKLSVDQLKRFYKYVDGGGGIANFVPVTVSEAIWKCYKNQEKKSIHKTLKTNGLISISEKELVKDEFGFGSQQTKNQNMIDGTTSIKKRCWKLEVDRLGNISKIVK